MQQLQPAPLKAHLWLFLHEPDNRLLRLGDSPSRIKAHSPWIIQPLLWDGAG